MIDTPQPPAEASDGMLPARSCYASLTPETDKAAYEATTRTVGKWIVPLAKARGIELSGREKELRLSALGEAVAWAIEVGQVIGGSKLALQEALKDAAEGTCARCAANGWDTERLGPCPQYPACHDSFTQNAGDLARKPAPQDTNS